MLSRMMSRRNLPSGRVFSATDGAGLRHLDGVVAEVRHAQRFAQQAAVGVRIGAHAAGAFGGQRFQLRQQRAVARRTVPRACSCAASLPAWQDAPAFSRRRSGTWCARQKPSTLWPSTSFGPVQPLGERSTIIGQRGRDRLCRCCAPPAGCGGFPARIAPWSRPLPGASARDRCLRRNTASSRSP